MPRIGVASNGAPASWRRYRSRGAVTRETAFELATRNLGPATSAPPRQTSRTATESPTVHSFLGASSRTGGPNFPPPALACEPFGTLVSVDDVRSVFVAVGAVSVASAPPPALVRRVDSVSGSADAGVRAVLVASRVGPDVDVLVVAVAGSPAVAEVAADVRVVVGGGVAVVSVVVDVAVVVDGGEVVVAVVAPVVVVRVTVVLVAAEVLVAVVAVAVTVVVAVVVTVVVVCSRSHSGYRGFSYLSMETPVSMVRAVSGFPRFTPVPRTVCVPGGSTRCSRPSGKCRMTVALEFVSTVAW
ncbi:hypothetical protein [Haladaptatus salinisoli]|uniref:hypothetical protein n=1 Tax=Haladaptatus salinisoli TaxID=2884876 RepID=UPI001D09C28A|nr:hypothetical protein [Haladaptatus salinisoli]